jgi:drug/metabolite transporter (DMT)-like permease
MTWLFWILLAAVCSASEKCMHRFFLSKSAQEWEYMFGYNIGALLLLVILTISNLHSISFDANFILLVLSGALWFFSCLFSFKADRFMEVSMTSLVSQLQIVLVCVGGILFFNEHLSTLQSLGVLLIFAGLSILFHAKRGQLNVGIVYKLVSTTASSAALLLDKKLVLFYTPSLVAISGFIIPTLISTALRPHQIVTGSRFILETRFYSVAMGLLGGLGYFAFVKSLSTAPISIVFPVFQLNVVLTVLLGILVLKEKSHVFTKIISASIIILGTVLLK